MLLFFKQALLLTITLQLTRPFNQTSQFVKKIHNNVIQTLMVLFIAAQHSMSKIPSPVGLS